MTSQSSSEIVRIRVRAGTRIHATDPYWPHNGRLIRKDRIVGARQIQTSIPRLGAYWEWVDPKSMRTRWAREEDCERV